LFSQSYFFDAVVNRGAVSRPAATKIARIKLLGMSEFGTFRTCRSGLTMSDH
jgi:hypothetical protein